MSIRPPEPDFTALPLYAAIRANMMKRNHASMAEVKCAEEYETKQKKLQHQRDLVRVLQSAHDAQVLATQMRPPPNGYTEETLAASGKALVAAKMTVQSLVLYLEGLVHAAATDRMRKLSEDDYEAPKPSTAFCNKTGGELHAKHYANDYRALSDGVPANNGTMFPMKRQRCGDFNPMTGECDYLSPRYEWHPERPPASPGYCSPHSPSPTPPSSPEQ